MDGFYAHPPALSRSRPYQGVRVKDPVKELLRRKRNAEWPSTKTTSHHIAPNMTQEVITHNNQSTLVQGIFEQDIASCSRATSLECDGEMTQWRASLPVSGNGPTVTSWSSPDYSQQVTSAQPLAGSAGPTLTADVYMQTLCPSYTMLTYTQTPLLTNVGTIPVAATSCALPHMDLPDSGCAYIPWAQPLTTISTMISGVQFAPGSTTLSGSCLVQMPLSKSLASQGHQPHLLDPLEYSDQTNSKTEEVIHEDQAEELETPNLLDKILEDQGKDEYSGGKVSYSNSFFLPSGFDT
ncbi:POU domain class 2-associating factor 1 isoform X2 [Syngnathus typhle]|uniref:POU domain class 2-associating factor 1 isoform X2 n=1 Tax=Syngnathus typhle TaxID=161592 RepID=UPI002A6B0527|nr:POU domain class 2-associating factor 1 isoform X2 [Syngnathus typhle]